MLSDFFSSCSYEDNFLNFMADSDKIIITVVRIFAKSSSAFCNIESSDDI